MSRKLTIIWLTIIFSLFLCTAIIAFYESDKLLLIISEITIPLLYIVTIRIIYRLLRPVSIMARSLNMLREADFSSTLVKTGNKDVDSLVDVYNSMILRLREERLSIREKNHFLDLLIESSPLGIIVPDQDEKIAEVNKSACRSLGIRQEEAKGLLLSTLDGPLAKTISSTAYDEKKPVILADGKKYLCQKLFFMDHGFKHPFYLIEELTDELRNAEKEAYGKLIRMMAHEVNNTIGSVNSIMSSLSASPDSFRQDDRDELLALLGVAIQRNYQMNKFMQNFSNVVKLPGPEKERMSLNKSAKIVADSFSPAMKEKEAILHISLDQSDPEIYADRSQIEQVFSNIMKNSFEAIGNHSSISVITTSRPKAIIFEDDGPGLDEKAMEKLFTPFFSTKPGGQGIGLTLTREILFNHGFTFSFTNRSNGGTCFMIKF